MVAAIIAVRVWRTFLFTALAVALGSYIYLVERPRIEEEAAPDRLVDFAADDIEALTFAYPDSTTITVERAGDAWRMVAPVEAPADAQTVERLAEQIAGATVDRRIPMEEVESLAAYGLEGDGEQAKISITLEDGTRSADIIVGRTTPVGYQAYSRLTGADEIVITPLIFHTGVKKTPFELRDKSLFDVPAQSVIAATVFNNGESIELERAGDEWLLVKPVRDSADRQTVDGLIAAMNGMNALAFHDVPPPDATTGFDSPTSSFSVETADGKRYGFSLGARSNGRPPSYYLRRDGDGLVADVDEASRVHFDVDATELRDKKLFKCAAEDVVGMKFDRSDGDSFELAMNDDQTWNLKPMPSDALVREGIVKRTRSGLASLAASDVVAETADSEGKLQPYGLDIPQIIVTLEGRDGKSCGTVLASVLDAEAETPKHYVVRQDSPVVMTMPSYHYSRLDARRDDFVAKSGDAE